MSGRGRSICFSRLRRIAQALRESQVLDEKAQRQVAQAYADGTASEGSSGGHVGQVCKVEIALSIIELQRLSLLPIDLLLSLRKLSYATEEEGLERLAQVCRDSYSNDEFDALVKWLLRFTGEQASSHASKTQHSGRRATPGQHYESISGIEACGHVLHSLQEVCQASARSIDVEVTAFDPYLKSVLHSEDSFHRHLPSLLRMCNTIPISTKLYCLGVDFEYRRRRQAREKMYSDIYAGTKDISEGSSSRGSVVPILNIQRDSILRDSRELLWRADEYCLHDGIKINFSNEEGQDAGGLLKEWILLLSDILIQEVCTQEELGGTLSLKADASLDDCELLGIVLGLSLYHQVVINVSLSSCILKNLQGHDSMPASLEDLRDARPALAAGLKEILSWNEEDLTSSLAATFTYTTDSGLSVPLIEGGEDVAVTTANRDIYVQRVCDLVMIEQVAEQLAALRAGFDRVMLDITSTRLFSTKELELLLCGEEVPLDAPTIKQYCQVSANASDKNYLDLFWKLLNDLDGVQLKQLLHFVTANHRVSVLSPQRHRAFNIVVLHGEDFVARLPTASTCTNTLFLPRYGSAEILKTNLLTALQHGSVGFGLK